VNVDRVKIVAHVTSGAGALPARFLSAGHELYANAAVVVGGTLLTRGAGSFTMIGTLTAYVQQMVSGLFLIVLVQSSLARRAPADPSRGGLPDADRQRVVPRDVEPAGCAELGGVIVGPGERALGVVLARGA
jgi:hypothetical protein